MNATLSDIYTCKSIEIIKIPFNMNYITWRKFYKYIFVNIDLIYVLYEAYKLILLTWLCKLFHKFMDTLIALKSPVFDLLAYSIKLLVDRIPYGLYFNLKCKFKLMGKTEWKALNANI